MSRVRALLGLRQQPPRRARAALEWLVANGLGGYASGSVSGPPFRRFHGLLVAAHPAPAGRLMLLHAVGEAVHVGGWQRLKPCRVEEAGGDHLAAEFSLQAGLPHWTYQLSDGLTLEQSVMMPHGQNTVHIRYSLHGSDRPIRLRLRPWLDFRAHEGRLPPRPEPGYTCTEAGVCRWQVAKPAFPVTLGLQLDAASCTFADLPDEWTDVPYAIEAERGYDAVGSMVAPGSFEVVLEPDREAYLTATTGPWSRLEALPPAEAWTIELQRRERLLASSDPALQQPKTFLLPLAADQFIIRPASRLEDETQAHAAGAEARTVIAGYPWFTDWGRDTMISLEGLALATGRHAEARHILRTFALHVRDGLIPNLFPEGERDGLYHTADATLWFFHALHRYDTLSGDPSLVNELLPALEDIVRHHREGTLFNIKVDRDGLLTQGADGRQLTWMDALVDGWVVTPRRGKAVEINALWHNALVLLASWLSRAGRGLQADRLARDARRCREAFNARFWNQEARCLFDVVDGDRGDDAACRPNQVLAIAVTHPPLDRRYWEPVLTRVADELLTPFGLRTLSPGHPDFSPAYFGDLRTRDAAYHQGTVWPWLIGPFVDAWLAWRPDDVEGARTLLSSLLDHVGSDACLGSISEIFDAQPPHVPRGCCAQAWSVAEVARVLVKLGPEGGQADRQRGA
jgi:predicted glycogen debranching enzyme